MVEREASAGEDSFLAWNSLLLLSFLLCLEGEILLTFFASLVSRMKVNESVLRLKEKKTPSLDNDWQNPKHCCARVDTAAGVDIFPDFLNYFKMSVERFLTHLYWAVLILQGAQQALSPLQLLERGAHSVLNF